MSSATKIKETQVVTPRETIRGHTRYVRGIAHLPGGKCIITCSGALRLWDIQSGAQIGSEWRDEGDEAAERTMSLSPNGKTVASGNFYGTVRLWDIEMGKVVVKWKGHSDIVTSVCWSRNGERVVSGSWDGTARGWDVKSREPVQSLNPIETGHEHVDAVSYSPKAKMIATGGYNETGIKIWDAKTGEQLAMITLDRSIWSLAWTSDEKKLIGGTINGSIWIFDTATWQQIAVLGGHADAVSSLTLFPNDRLLASTSWDKTACLWNLDTNFQVGPPLQHEKDVECAAFSADGKLLSTGCQDNNAYVWDIQAILKAAGLEELLDIPKVFASSHGSSSKEHISGGASGKSFLEADATRGFGHASELSPRFFDNTQANARSSARPSARAKSSALLGCFPPLPHRSRRNQTIETQLPPAPSESRLHVLLNRLRSPPNISTHEISDLPQPPMLSRFRPQVLLGHLSSLFRSPHNADEAIELQHCPGQATLSHGTSHVVNISGMRDREVIFAARKPETASEMAKRIKNPKPWVRVVFFLCCVSPGSDDSPGANDTHRST